MTKIVIAGAGSIGCYIGGHLHNAGHDVTFLARPRIAQAVAADGLRLTDYAGNALHLKNIPMDTTPECLNGAHVVLVCVKSADTAEMAQDIAAQTASGTLVVSLQNGVTNADTLRMALPNHDVRAAMVPFNVVPKGPAAFHRATSGDILVQDGPMPDLSTPTLPFVQVDNIAGIQWGKLLINLGNALNALADIPLLTQLQDRAWRRLMADQMAEGLGVLKAAGIKPAKVTSAAPGVIPFVLRLPTPLFKRVAAQMLTIDAEARSSMWDDLTQRRLTEIDALQGTIIALAEKHGRSAPLNSRMRELIKAAEAAGNGPPGLSVPQIRET